MRVELEVLVSVDNTYKELEAGRRGPEGLLDVSPVR